MYKYVLIKARNFSIGLIDYRVIYEIFQILLQIHIMNDDRSVNV